MAVPGEKLDPVAIPLDNHTEPVVLDLVQPVPAGWHISGAGRDAWLELRYGMPPI
jgi:hypothetical protein